METCLYDEGNLPVGRTYRSYVYGSDARSISTPSISIELSLIDQLCLTQSWRDRMAVVASSASAASARHLPQFRAKRTALGSP